MALSRLITYNNLKVPFNVFAADGNDYFNQLLDNYQPEILRKILGEIEFYDLDQNETDAKWSAFISGDNYTVNSVVYDYKGIKPILAKFMYYYWQRETASILGEKGNLYNDSGKIKQIVPRGRMVNAYNKACFEINNNTLNYPTVYHFLTEHPTYEFDDLNYTETEKINEWNL